MTTRDTAKRDPSGVPALGIQGDSGDEFTLVKGDETVNSLHVTMWKWNSSSLEWEKWDGKIDTIVSGDLIVAVDNLEQYILDNLSQYKLSDWLVDGDIVYVGKLAKDGKWFIKKIDTANGQVRYVSGSSGYSFADPASLSYDDFATEF